MINLELDANCPRRRVSLSILPPSPHVIHQSSGGGGGIFTDLGWIKPSLAGWLLLLGKINCPATPPPLHANSCVDRAASLSRPRRARTQSRHAYSRPSSAGFCNEALCHPPRRRRVRIPLVPTAVRGWRQVRDFQSDVFYWNTIYDITENMTSNLSLPRMQICMRVLVYVRIWSQAPFAKDFSDWYENYHVRADKKSISNGQTGGGQARSFVRSLALARSSNPHKHNWHTTDRPRPPPRPFISYACSAHGGWYHRRYIRSKLWGRLRP